MASFTDSIPQFNPYVKQLPVEAMVAVGMEKQKRYDEGVQKIQQSIDTIAGLQVDKDIEKAYLQSKLNQLGNDLTFVAAGDFSNYQLVNSVDGMAKQIAYDPNIQTAISSAAKRRKEYEFMEEARKKGELTPQNELYFKTRDADWVNNTELGQAYNAKYVNYFDTFKYARETFDALKIDDLTFDQIFELDANGKPIIDKTTEQPVYSQYMTRLKEEGYKPEKLQSAINQIFSDPRVVQQLSIDGEYNYRNLSPEAMTTLTTQEFNKVKDSIEDDLDELYIKLQINPEDVEIKEAIQKKELSLSKLPELLKAQAQSIYENPNSARASLYTQKTKQDYINMFNFTKSSKEIMRNPAFDVNFEIQKEKNRRLEFFQNLAWDKEKFGLTYLQKQAELDLKARELSEASAKGTASDFTQDVQSPVNTWLGEVNDLENARIEAENSNLELIFASVFPMEQIVPNKFKTVNGEQVPLTNADIYNKALTANKGDRAKAIKSIINAKATSKNLTYDAYVSTLTTRVQDQFGKAETREKLRVSNPDLYNTLNIFEKNQVAYIDQKADYDGRSKRTMDKFFETMEKIPFTEKKVTVGGETFELTKQDAIHLALIAKLEDNSFISGIIKTDEYVGFQQAAEAAKTALIKQGKEKLINSFLNQYTSKQNRTQKVVAPYIGKEIVDFIGEAITGTPSEDSRYDNYIKYGKKVYEDVYNIYDNIEGKTFAEALKKRSEDYVATSYKNPNITSPIMMYTVDKQGNKTVDAKAMNTTLAAVQDIATTYKNRELGEGINHKDFIKNALKAEPEDMMKYKKGVMFTGTGYREYLEDLEGNKLFITPTEAAQKFKFTSTSAYESPRVTSAKEAIKKPENNLSTTKMDISNVNTYNYPAQMNSWDFPAIAGSKKYTAKAHFKQNPNDRTYFPYLYVSNGVNPPKVVPLQLSDPSLVKLMQETLPKYVTPDLIESLLNR
jgi:hypothetical protein